MLENITANLTQLPQKGVYIILFYLIAWIVHSFAGRIAGRVSSLSRFNRRGEWNQERSKTLHQLITSAISFTAFMVATVFSLSLFVDSSTLIWIIGLFSAAFGLSVGPLLRDFLTGISFIFEDTFHVGDKVEIMGIEGAVEAVNLRTTLLRAPSGELFIMPNGEIRIVRNFSRGRFSTADIKLKISATDLPQALPLLTQLGHEAADRLPDLLEPWQVISDSGVIGQHTELTLIAKTRFSKAASLRPQLLTLIQEQFSEAGITLTD
jgi:moderate conductance mechanosensitive channel